MNDLREECIGETVCGKLDWPLAPYDTPWDGDVAAKALADWARKDDGMLDATKLKQCALWIDPAGDPGKGSSYKLIFCRKGVDGPEIVPQRIFDIAGVLNGAHGGLKGVSDVDQAEIKRKIVLLYHRIAKANPKQDVQVPFQESTVRPQKRIGQLKICWLEYNARSLNGRIYPKATCDRIYQSGLRKLADPGGLPITTFVSHETANSNVNTELAGRVSKLWQEGNRFWALIDLADTRAAHDMLALAEGGYLKSGSMRVLGVELMHDRNYDVPLVVCSEGIEPELAGIDLTTKPGLADSARITQVLYESSDILPYVASFSCSHLSIESKEDLPVMSIPLFVQILLGHVQEARQSRSKEAHLRIHDHIAGVMDAVHKPIHGTESTRLIALVESELTEEGRALAKKHMIALSHAHDEAAKQCGMACECGYRESLGLPANPDDQMDGDSDGDSPATGYDPDNDGESAQQKEKSMTETKLLATLKAKGYTIEAPKTAEQKKMEEQDLKIAALAAKVAELTESAPPARQTMGASSQFEESSILQPEKLYRAGDYLKGDLHPKNWRALANSEVPWPQDLDPALVLHELTPYMNYNLLNMQEAAVGRSLREEVKLGFFD